LLESFEAMAMRDCDLALPMCQALSDRVQHVAPGKPCFVVEDFALSAPQTPATTEDLKAHWKTRPDKLVLYAGNLAHYQGIDLLLRALQVLDAPTVGLAIVGGKGNEIQTWSDRAEALGVAARVRFLGARPLVQLSTLLQQADVLVSPRIEGENTPMKIYGYLASGRPVVATDIRAHSQVLDESCALLTRIQPEALADALRQLLDDPGRCHQLGLRGIERIAQCEFTREAFEARLLAAYSRLRDSKPAC
jgi:glycosyltransferase involved in cell wall biosynthesis